ncbi:MAG: UDP-3-O-acyl-N-acetylglucosamine deacetylase [Phycisphaerales bacterium]
MATLRRLAPLVPIRMTGPGLFTGRVANLTISGPMGREGLWFQREDLEVDPRVRATADALSDEPLHPAFASLPARCTTLRAAPGVLFGTVEHILSALDALGITDALVEFSEAETPILDGCAQRFVDMLAFSEPVEKGPLEVRTLPHSVEVVDARDPSARIVASPRASAGRSYRYDLDYSGLGSGIGSGGAAAERPRPSRPRAAAWDGTPEQYADQVAPARTFCLRSEYDAMRAAGMLDGIPEDAAVVFGADGPVNTELRFANEASRHKLLDLIGDLALIGERVQMDVHAVRSGHALNQRLARAVRDVLGLGGEGRGGARTRSRSS